jgi:hypothetical protein
VDEAVRGHRESAKLYQHQFDESERELQLAYKRIEELAAALREITPEKLRCIADWFDTYDAMAEAVVIRASSTVSNEDQEKALEVVRRKDIQADLRSWAALLDTEAASAAGERSEQAKPDSVIEAMQSLERSENPPYPEAKP